MDRKWVGAILFACWIAGIVNASQQSGISIACDLNGCATAAGTTPAAVIASLILAVFVASYPQKPATVIASGPVTVIRQVAALFVDFGVIMLTVAPASALVVLAIEAMQTGTFAWVFSRTFVRLSDWGLVALVLTAFVALFQYCHWHFARSRRTAGEYLLGYTTIPIDGKYPDARRHAWRVFAGLFLWPLAALTAAQHQDKTLWWNRASGLKAASVA